MNASQDAQSAKSADVRAKVDRYVIEVCADDSADASYLDQEGFEDRRRRLEAGEFYFCGVRLAAQLLIPYGTDYIIETIRTPGLWGIEDDSGEDYFRSVAEDEFGVMGDMLAALNVKVRKFNADEADVRYGA